MIMKSVRGTVAGYKQIDSPVDIVALPSTSNEPIATQPKRDTRTSTARYRDLFNVCACQKTVTEEESRAGENVIRCQSKSCETRYVRRCRFSILSDCCYNLSSSTSTAWVCSHHQSPGIVIPVMTRMCDPPKERRKTGNRTRRLKDEDDRPLLLDS